MRRITHTVMGTLAALVLGASLASAQAPATNNTTIVTFSAPVSLPGVTLPAGSYMFKLADSQVNRNIVQVFDKDRTKILATILAIPAERNEPADDTVITFGESPANMAPAIKYWYYPGDKRGQEFAYPKSQAQNIANASHTSVLSIDSDDTSAAGMQNGKLSRVEPSADAAQSASQTTQPSSSSTMSQSPNAASAATAQQPSAATTPSESAQSNQAPATKQPGATPPAESTPSASTQSPSTPSAQSAPATSAPAASASSTPSQSSRTPSTASSASTASETQGAVGTSGQATSTQAAGKRSSLPKTASTLPLIGFAGLLALASAFGVRALRRVHA
jgi:hypothetical protein